METGERAEIEGILGHTFSRPELLERALTHRSYRASDSSCVHNEQLEFLGDAVIGLLVGEFLVREFPDWSEGPLSKTRARLASARSLAEVGRRLNLGRFLRLGPGEEKTGGRTKPTLLANAYEALVAALFLDAGLEAPARFLRESLILPAIRRSPESLAASDYKSALQEWLQARGLSLACYRIVAETGPDHAKTFLIEIEAAGRVLARCSGASKKEAEQAVAARALERLREETPTETPARA
jgi:ribonuclease-3